MSRTIRPRDVTLSSYQAAAAVYREQLAPETPVLRAFLDEVVARVGPGLLLEIGSGPGREASYLEQRGVRLQRSDATPAFVEMMQTEGYDARLLDVRRDDLGGPYDGIFANAVLLHLGRDELAAALARMRAAVVDGGLLAFSVKEGDGEGWSEAKLGLPRHFTYWREGQLRPVVESAGWRVDTIEAVMGRVEPWLYVFATRA